MLYTSVFAAMLLLAVWIFQVLLLDFFYENAVRKEIVQAAQYVNENIDDTDIITTVDAVASHYSIDIKVLTVNNYGTSYVQSLSYGSLLNNDNTVRYYIYMTDTNDGEYLARHTVVAKDFEKPNINHRPDIKKDNAPKKLPEPESESLVYCLKTSTQAGNTAYIIVNAELTPLDSTVNTIQNQLISLSVIFIIISAAMGIFIARKISTPIIKINQSAKKLALGDYSPTFEGNGFKETQELSDTLNYAAEELSKVDKLRRELIANVSHDLRTPLTMITGYSEVMRDIPGENTPENVQVIIDEAEHLCRLVNDILSISKIEAGMDTANKTYYDLTENIKNIVSRYSKMKAADGYDIQFIYSENIFVNADELKISQVVYNLINNAIAYTGDDKKVRIIQTKTEKGVRIEVHDTGCGISQNNIKNIWDRYYKEDKTHKRAGVGTGLGLSIVKGVIDLHGGTYGVVSKEGEGSVFWFELEI